MKIIVCGDIHCDWPPLNKLINKKKPDIILQCGDYGWWPHLNGNRLGLSRKRWNQFGVKNHQNGVRTKIFWCPGNHENWDSIDEFGGKVFEIQDDIFCCPFGHTMELPTGETVLFAGGADSIDKLGRIEGHSWWPQELISQEEMDNLPDVKVDIVISHTVPRTFMGIFQAQFRGHVKSYGPHDPSTFALDLVFEKYRPKKWFSGHFHQHMVGEYLGCKWVGLDMPGHGGRWWIEL